jgi:hypothetical protein
VNHPLQHWMKAAGFGGTWSELARLIVERVPSLFSQVEKAERHRRVALELSRLSKGQTSWWRNHDEARKALASLLKVSEAHLLEGEPAGKRIPFPEFPALRPLDLASEGPLTELGKLRKPDGSQSIGSNLFYRADLAPKSPLWAQVPPGAGKTLALHLFQRRGLACKTVRRLADTDLSELKAHQTFILKVEFTDPQTDLDASQRLLAHPGLTVLAPFARPGSSVEYEASIRSSRPHTRSEEPGWKDRAWNPEPGWRSLFIGWVAQRLGSERKEFDSQALDQWLGHLDPDTQLVRTPGEILTLCDLAYEMGTPKLIRQFTKGWNDVAKTVTSRMIQRQAQDDSNRALWLRAAGADAVRTLTRTAFEDVAAPWPPSASQEVWADRLPPRYAAPALDKVVDEKLHALGQARGTRARQQRMQEAKAALFKPSPLMAIEYLASANLLRVQPDGGVGPYPLWMANALARERLDDVSMLAPELWGRWAAEPGRQPLLDSAFDSLPPPKLAALAERAVHSFAAFKLGAVGAVESLFAAFARRFALPPSTVQEELLHRLVQCQLQVLTRRFTNGALGPVTRPGIGEGSNTWLADCWSWSFSVTRPPWPLPQELHWLFPGWATPSLTAPESQQYLMDERQQKGSPDGGLERLMAHSVQVLDRCCATTPPKEVPVLLAPSVLVWAARRGIHLEASLVRDLLSHGGFQERLQRHFPSEEPRTQTAMAALLFRGMALKARGVLNVFRRGEQPLTDPLLGRLEDSVIFLAIQESGPGSPSVLSEVPPRVLLPVVKHFIERSPRELDSFRVGTPETGHVPILELLLKQGFPSGERAQALWRLSPERSLQQAAQALGQDPIAPSTNVARDLLFASPLEFRAELLDALEARPPGVKAPWVSVWLAREVRRGGTLAERAHVLCRELQPVLS